MPLQGPILVTGIPRSGTSMITGIIHLSGVVLPSSTTTGRASDGRRYRSFESSAVIAEIGRLFVEVHGRTPFDAVVENYGPISNVHFGSRIGAAVYNEVGPKPWVAKDIYLPYTYPSWVRKWPDIQVVVVCRPMEEILKSMEYWQIDPVRREILQPYVDNLRHGLLRLISMVPEEQLIMAHSNLTAKGDLSWLKTLAERKALKPNYEVLKSAVIPKSFDPQSNAGK